MCCIVFITKHRLTNTTIALVTEGIVIEVYILFIGIYCLLELNCLLEYYILEYILFIGIKYAVRLCHARLRRPRPPHDRRDLGMAKEKCF